jgi:hypothetical protein
MTKKAHQRYVLSILFGFFFSIICSFYEIEIHSSLKNKTINIMTIILILAGLLGFAIFFKSIDFFDKI